MPIVQITLIEGRDEATVKRCIQEVARTVHATLGAPLESIRVLVSQLPATQWSVGDRTKDEIDAARAARENP
ncbi:tautomerase family protein [Cupriavidus sp. 2TAF22]|uniref:tautomerase family protein n=1 Tax=unclassified Cupriavidus TaxID=2640874 RepID=UPI003F91BAB0